MNKPGSTRPALAFLLGSGVVTQAVMFLAALILARLYDPIAFGDLGLYTGIGALVAVISGLRYDHIAYSQTPQRRDSLFITAYIASILVLLLLVSFLLFLKILIDSANYSASWSLVFCICSSVFYLNTQYLISIRAYRDFAWFRVLQALLQLVIGLLFFKLFPSYGLLMAYAVSQFSIGILIFIKFRKRVTVRALQRSVAIGRHFFRRACENSLVVILQYSTAFAPVLVGYTLYIKEDVGAYYLFAQLFSAPLAIFRRSLMSYLNAEASSPTYAVGLYKSHRKEIAKYAFILALLFLSSCCVLVFFDRPLVNLLFGASWHGYSSFLLPLLVFFFIDAVLQPFTTLLTLWGYQSSAIKYEAARFLGIFFVVPAVVMSFNFSFYYFFVLYSTVMILTYVLIFSRIVRLSRIERLTGGGGQ